tara:strand:- start:8465 stop:8941 length:477 start_codon:yes stop_codon:yes gene_type:complete
MKEPIGANVYGSKEGQDQVILDSGRLLFHAKSDYIMSYSDKGFSFSTNGGFHINGGDKDETSITHINTKKIYLGLDAESKGEPVLMGDLTEQWLQDLISSLEGILDTWITQIGPLMWPPAGGAAQVPAAMSNYVMEMENLRKGLESIKSKSVFLIKEK